jgi:(2Fe-2S) ferredoxin
MVDQAGEFTGDAAAPDTMEAAGDEVGSGSYFAAHLFVCCNRRPDGHPRGSCAASGSEALRDYMKNRVKVLKLQNIRVNIAGCLDRCELGPCLVIYPEGVWYKITTTADVDAVLERHVRDGGRVPELMLPGR